MNTEAVSPTGKSASKGTLAAALSAVGSVLAALTCCLPVLPFVLAAGTASSARFLSSYIGALRPYLLGGFRPFHCSRVLSKQTRQPM
jgi:hypothetical protein